MRAFAQKDNQSQKRASPASAKAGTGQNRAERAAPRCPCGGGCPKCQTQSPDRSKLESGASVGAGTIPEIAHSVARKPGLPLDAATRSFMEPRFGHDLADVRVHTGAEAAESARAVEAQAYTVGQHVVFGDNKFAPATQAGRELLAHELAHTIQQRGASGPPPVDDMHSIHERTARTASRSIAHGHPMQGALPASGVGLSRAPIDDDERAKAIAEALAVVASIEKGQKETEEEEKEEAAESKRPVSIRPRSLSLLQDDPTFKASLVTDEEIYAAVREPKPEEPEYWGNQAPERLEKPIKIGSATIYVRKWETVTIEGAGDQGDKHVDVEKSHWVMTRPALRGYLEYMVGTLTPFEESLVQGGVPMPEGFTPVAAGSQIGYYVQSGESGMRQHVIYNRDGTSFRSWTSEAALVNMGIGPLALALPGIGLRSLAGSAATLGRAGLGTAGRIAIRAAERLKPLARKGVITAKLALGRAQAGAVSAAPTAFGGIASRNAVTMVDPRPVAAVVGKAAPAVAAETTAVKSVSSTTQTAPTQPATSTAPATGEIGSAGSSGGFDPRRTLVAFPPPMPIPQPAPHVHAGGGVPDRAIPDEEAITQRTRPGERVGEQVGGYTISGEKELVGSSFRRRISGLFDNDLPTLVLQKGGPLRIKKIKQLFRLMIDEARAAGATELHISGEIIRNPHVARLGKYVESLGGSVVRIDAMTKVWVIPVRPL